ncbi:MAG: beta-ACP synthase, partial [Mesorhizobium sp.]
MLKRVVITGIGGLCGLGTNAAAMWSEMRAGRSAIGPIDNPLLHDLKVKIGCEIKELPEHGIDRKQLVSMDRFSLLAVIAAREAMQQSGLATHADNTYRMGAVVGVGVCGFEAIEENYRAILIEKKNRAGIFTVPKVMPGAAAGQVSMNLG